MNHRELKNMVIGRLSGVAKFPESEADLIMSYVFDMDRMDVRFSEDEVQKQQLSLVNSIVQRRIAREPLQYILRQSFFRFLELEVGPGVLIPRPETEILAQWVIDRAIKIADNNQGEKIRMLDLGTGSGAISIAAATEIRKARPGLKFAIDAFDICDRALFYAKINAEKYDVTDIISFAQVDFADENQIKPTIDAGPVYDIVYSNPPYIEDEKKADLAPEIVSHEPLQALFAGDGYDAYRAISKILKYILKPEGAAIFEMEHHQYDKIKQLIEENISADIYCKEDYCGRRRFTCLNNSK